MVKDSYNVTNMKKEKVERQKDFWYSCEVENQKLSLGVH